MIDRLRRHRAATALVACGLAAHAILALVLFPAEGFATDLGLFWGWATSLAAHGPGSFYASTSSANYPPGYLYVLWLLGVVGNPALLKLPPVLADIGMAALAYALARRWRGERSGLIAATLVLVLPFAWYDSALWGQVDAVGTFVALAALLLLVEGWSEAALTAAVLAVLVKPQYLITLVVVVPVLVARHLVRPGSGPQPLIHGRLARLDARLGGLLHDQGPRRLASSAVAAGVVGLLVILPFDLASFAPASLVDVPVIAQAAGLIGLFIKVGGEYSVLTANAFNPWALAGNPSLVAAMASGGSWQADSLTVAGGLSAVMAGGILLAAVGTVVAGGLLVRNDAPAVLLAFTVLALAFFVLPTRVHERYLFPFFATGAVMVASSIPACIGLAALSLLNTANLHAVLTGAVSVSAGGGPGGGVGRGPGGFGGGPGGVFGSISLPLGNLAAGPIVVTASALGLALALVLLLGAWVRLVAGTRRAANPRANPAGA